MKSHFIVLSALVAACLCQRSPYAGRDPIGFPKVEVTTTTTTAAPLNSLGNRFGENAATTTTQRLPIEALGDRELVNRLGQLPVDNRPFWLLNAQALEEHRKQPHTFDLKPNVFNHNFGFPQQNGQFNQFEQNAQFNQFEQNAQFNQFEQNPQINRFE